MGTKVTISDFGSVENSSFITSLNAMKDTLADEFDSVVYADGSIAMSGDLDMDSNRILNLPAPLSPTEPLRAGDVEVSTLTGYVDAAEASALAAATSASAASTSASNASTSASNASTSASNASSSAAAAAASAASVNPGVPNGIAQLDGSGLVPLSQLPGISATWGAISGTLSNQTDLQSALDGKASSSHSHAWGSITGTLANQTDLQSALDGKASSSHNHDSTYLNESSNLSDLANVATARTNLGLGNSALLNEATVTEFRNNTANRVLTTDITWSSAASVVLTPGATVTPNFANGFNFTLAMGGNYTLANPTNMKAGQSGMIEITQDGTGSRTLAYGTAWVFAGGTDPVLSTTASAKDLLIYQVLGNGTQVYATLIKAVA